MSSDGYEDYHGSLTPHEQRELVWSAHSAGYIFRVRFGPDADPVGEQAMADLAGKLGQMDDGGPEWRSRLLRAYAGGVNYWRKIAGEPEVTV